MRAAQQLLLALALGWSGCASAIEYGEPIREQRRGVTLIDQYNHFPITGANRADIGQSLRRSGIAWGDGRKFEGAYVAKLRWEWRRQAESRTVCRVSDAQVFLSGSVTLPRWTAPASAPAALREDWRRFEAALRAHEMRHRQIAIDHATALRETLRRLRARDCAALDRRIDEEGRRLSGELDAAQAAYDRRTRHGLAEGTRWPPD